MTKCIFSVDVEDWFHILDVPSTPALPVWESLPSRVEGNFLKLLDILSEAHVQATCFFLGWVGEKYPALVVEAATRGHEIASHGYAHMLVHHMTSADFYQDIRRAKEILEDAAGRRVSGYRAPGFSASHRVPWFFDQVAKAGYHYDSSVFPGSCEHGGWNNGHYEPYLIETQSGRLLEFPLTTARLLGKRICVFGGGHLRLAPLRLICGLTRQVLSEGCVPVVYVHPREVDPGHPRLPMSLRRHFKSYVNLRSTERKLRYLLAKFRFTSFDNVLAGFRPESGELDSIRLGLWSPAPPELVSHSV